MTGTAEFTGGLRYGRGYFLSFNISRPFVKLSITSKGISVRTPYFNGYSFRRDEELRLSEYWGFISSGLRIEHDNSEYPTFFVFWTSELEKLKQTLTTSGYMVVSNSE